jgi:hypothetical protein
VMKYWRLLLFGDELYCEIVSKCIRVLPCHAALSALILAINLATRFGLSPLTKLAVRYKYLSTLR